MQTPENDWRPVCGPRRREPHLGRRVLAGTFLALASVWSDAAIAATLCVKAGGADGCFASIQSALDVAARSDTVAVGAGTYVEDLVVPRSLAIVGENQATTIVDGGGAGSVVTTLAKTTVEISNLTLTGGIGTQLFLPATTRVGGGVLARGRLSLVDVAIVDNTADCGSSCGSGGGGLFAADRAGRLRLERCVVAGNSSHFGAGVHAPWGKIVIVDSTIADNDGPGVDTVNGRAKLEIQGSTISGNQNVGIRIQGTAKVANTTVSGNGSVFAMVGGIQATGPGVTINYVTVAGNVAGACHGCAIGIQADRRTTIQNSIIADNVNLQWPSIDCSGFRSRGFNLAKGPCSTWLPNSSDRFGVDPLLGPLADNGGPTQTHALLTGSPAIDAGSPGPQGKSLTSRCLAVDQRSEPRTGTCDVGAFEF